MHSAEIGIAEPTDWRGHGAMIGTAFAQDPVLRWIFGDPGEIVRTFQRLARYLYLPLGICHTAGTGNGAQGGTMWLPPGTPPALSLSAMLAIGVPALLRARLAPLIRALRADATMQHHHPKIPHYYLFAVGVLPEARGQGLARQLIAPVLTRCDSESMPAYLENSNPRNTGLYESFGFVAQNPFKPAPGCPPMLPMWRTPNC